MVGEGRAPSGEDEGHLLDQLIGLSRALGADPALVVAGGGNTSLKVGRRLVVKASGQFLARATRDSFVELGRDALQALLARDLGPSRGSREAAYKDGLLAARLRPEVGQRPSVESLVHHVMPGRFVAHVHANLVNQFSCCARGEALVMDRLGAEIAWAPLADPGFALARVLERVLAEYVGAHIGRSPRAVVLENHGLVVSGGTPEEAVGHLNWLLSRLADLKSSTLAGAASPSAPPGTGPKAPVKAQPLAGPAVTGQAVTGQAAAAGALARALSGTHGDGRPVAVIFDGSADVISFVTSRRGHQLTSGGPLTPDQVVYCRSVPLWLRLPASGTEAEVCEATTRAVAAYASRHGYPPAVVLVEDVGLFACAPTHQQAAAARDVYADAIKLMNGADELGGIRYLDEDFCEFIENWEVEAYRKHIAAAT